jgi:hypothetical protein
MQAVRFNFIMTIPRDAYTIPESILHKGILMATAFDEIKNIDPIFITKPQELANENSMLTVKADMDAYLLRTQRLLAEYNLFAQKNLTVYTLTVDEAYNFVSFLNDQ